jgi:hypothetical protein
MSSIATPCASPGDAERLELAGSLAADLGVEVWFSPFTGDQTADSY